MPSLNDAMTDAEISRLIRDTLAAIVNPKQFEALSDSEDLFGAGVIDSFGVLQLIEGLESAFEISIPDEELIPQNLWSVASIRDLVKRLEPPKLSCGRGR